MKNKTKKGKGAKTFKFSPIPPLILNKNTGFRRRKYGLKKIPVDLRPFPQDEISVAIPKKIYDMRDSTSKKTAKSYKNSIFRLNKKNKKKELKKRKPQLNAIARHHNTLRMLENAKNRKTLGVQTRYMVKGGDF